MIQNYLAVAATVTAIIVGVERLLIQIRQIRDDWRKR